MLGFGFSFTNTQRTAFTALQTKGSIQNPALLCAQFDTIEYIKKEGHMGAQYFNLATHFARASAKSVIGPNGDLMDLAANAIPYDLSSGKRRLLMEGQRVNHVKRSSHTAAYPWNDTKVHNGITATRVGTGFVGDVPYAEFSLTGTATSGYSEPFVSSGYSVTSGAQGETWTASCYFQLISGVWPAGVKISAGVYEQVGGSYLGGASGSGHTPTDEAHRYSVTYSTVEATTNEVRSAIGITFMTPEVTTFTGQVVRIYGWQLEEGSGATTLIQTLQNVAATRAPDLLTMSNLSGLEDGFWVVLPKFAVAEVGSGFDRVVQFDDGDNDNRSLIYYHEGNQTIGVQQFFGDDNQASTVKPYTLGDVTRIAVRFGPDKFAVVWEDGSIYEDANCEYVAPEHMYLAASGASAFAKPAAMSLAGIMLHPPSITPAQMAAHLGGLS